MLIHCPTTYWQIGANLAFVDFLMTFRRFLSWILLLLSTAFLARSHCRVLFCAFGVLSLSERRGAPIERHFNDDRGRFRFFLGTLPGECVFLLYADLAAFLSLFRGHLRHRTLPHPASDPVVYIGSDRIPYPPASQDLFGG